MYKKIFFILPLLAMTSFANAAEPNYSCALDSNENPIRIGQIILDESLIKNATYNVDENTNNCVLGRSLNATTNKIRLKAFAQAATSSSCTCIGEINDLTTTLNSLVDTNRDNISQNALNIDTMQIEVDGKQDLIAVGTAGQVLTSDGTELTWEDKDAAVSSLPASAISVDNSDAGISATEVQAALKELKTAFDDYKNTTDNKISNLETQNASLNFPSGTVVMMNKVGGTIPTGWSDCTSTYFKGDRFIRAGTPGTTQDYTTAIKTNDFTISGGSHTHTATNAPHSHVITVNKNYAAAGDKKYFDAHTETHQRYSLNYGINISGRNGYREPYYQDAKSSFDNTLHHNHTATSDSQTPTITVESTTPTGYTITKNSSITETRPKNIAVRFICKD